MDLPQSLKEVTMTLPRKQLVAVEDTPYYHVVSAVSVAVTCVVLMLIPAKTMSIADGGLRTVFGFHRHSLPSIFVATR